MEGLEKTKNELINIGRPLDFDEDQFLQQLQGLAKAAYQDRDDIREIVADIVPTYAPVEKQTEEAKSETF